jgi:hypothetical protein
MRDIGGITMTDAADQLQPRRPFFSGFGLRLLHSEQVDHRAHRRTSEHANNGDFP